MFVIYFLVCGGAYGSEDLGSTLPPLYSLLGILLCPWLFGFPLAMLTAELACAMPDAEGFMLWTESTFCTSNKMLTPPRGLGSWSLLLCRLEHYGHRYD